MCLRGPPPPVFIDGGGSQTLFLDDLFGWTLADRLRSLGGYRSLHAYADNPYGFLCGSPDSYLSCSFSSLWSIGVFLLSFTAGMTLSFRKKTAFAILGTGIVVSLLDTGVRFAHRFGRGPDEYRDMMVDGLSRQLGANLLFQMVLPFAAAVLLMRLGRTMRGLLTKES
jgi:hypothetical protein